MKPLQQYFRCFSNAYLIHNNISICNESGTNNIIKKYRWFLEIKTFGKLFIDILYIYHDEYFENCPSNGLTELLSSNYNYSRNRIDYNNSKLTLLCIEKDISKTIDFLKEKYSNIELEDYINDNNKFTPLKIPNSFYNKYFKEFIITTDKYYLKGWKDDDRSQMFN
jgi:hypothetical protein